MPDDSFDPHDTSRPRGVLNERERDYLLGKNSDIKKGEKTAEERGVRQSIRKHIRHALIDFQIIYKELEERDRDQIIPGTGPQQNPLPDSPYSPGWIMGGRTGMLAFAFQLAEHEKDFEESLERGIEWAVRESGWHAEVDINIDLKRTDRIDTLIERVEAGGGAAVSGDELFTLLTSGRISREEWKKLREELRSNPE